MSLNNYIKKAWRPYGVDIQMSAPGLKRIIDWGTKNHMELSLQNRIDKAANDYT